MFLVNLSLNLMNKSKIILTSFFFLSTVFFGKTNVRIASFFVSDAFASTPAFIKVENRLLITVDLLSQNRQESLKELHATLLQELNVSPLSPQRKDELHVALGLIEKNANQPTQAIAYFERIKMTSLLYPSVLYLKFKTYLELSHAASAPVAAQVACQKAELFLKEALIHTFEPYQKDLQNELVQLHACKAKALLALDPQNSELSALVPYVLQSPLEQSPEDRKKFLEWIFASKTATAPQLHSLLEELTQRYPNDTWVNSKLAQFPEAKSLPLPSKRSEKIPPLGIQEDAATQAFADAQKFKLLKKLPQEIDQLLLILNEFPQTDAAQKASSRLQTLAQTLPPKEVDFFIKDFARAPPKPLSQLARTLWERELQEPSIELHQKLITLHPFSESAQETEYFLGRLYEDKHDWKQARTHFQAFAQKNALSKFYKRALFKIGLLSYLLKDYEQAIYALNKYRVEVDHPNAKAEALFWMSRAYADKKQTQLSQQFKNELAFISPLSFYAFLVGQLPNTFPDPLPKYTSSHFSNSKNVELAKTFLASGLPRFAATILEKIDLKAEPQLSFEIAQLFGISKKHSPAMALSYDLIHRNYDQIPQVLLEMIFPKEFRQDIETQAKKYTLPQGLLYAIVKQESAFQAEAQSPVGALGLMQLMPKTAERVALELERPSPTKNDLFSSEKNIELGAKYLHKLLTQFSGNLVYAIAAYNAGPEKVKTWITRWGNLPQDLFIELIPFDETRDYVKLVLRNHAFYAKLLSQPLPNLDENLKKPSI